MISAENVAQTEHLLARLAGRGECCLMPRGTTAIYIACKIIGDSNGYGEVIVPAVGCLSIPQAVALSGHQPVFADVDLVTGCLCPLDLSRRITPLTRAILPIHIFGSIVDVRKLSEIAARHGIPVVEDACHAFGGRMAGQPVGSWGMFSIASFGGTKTIGGLGGGALLFDDAGLRRDVDRHIMSLDPALPGAEAELLAVSHRNLYHAVVDFRRATAQRTMALTVGCMSAAYSPLLLSRSEVPSEAIKAITASVASLERLTAQRLAAARFYDGVISHTPCNRVPIEVIETNEAVWRYTFTCPSPGSTLSLTRALRRAGIHASNHYWSLADIWDGSADLPNAAWFQQRVVNLWVNDVATPEYLHRTESVITDWANDL